MRLADLTLRTTKVVVTGINEKVYAKSKAMVKSVVKIDDIIELETTVWNVRTKLSMFKVYVNGEYDPYITPQQLGILERLFTLEVLK